MNCYDCAAHGKTTPAIAVCADCGAALCGGHAHVVPRWLTRTLPITREVPVEPPARAIRCTVCQAAREAARQEAGTRTAGSGATATAHDGHRILAYLRTGMPARPEPASARRHHTHA